MAAFPDGASAHHEAAVVQSTKAVKSPLDVLADLKAEIASLEASLAPVPAPVAVVAPVAAPVVVAPVVVPPVVQAVVAPALTPAPGPAPTPAPVLAVSKDELEKAFDTVVTFLKGSLLKLTLGFAIIGGATFVLIEQAHPAVASALGV